MRAGVVPASAGATNLLHLVSVSRSDENHWYTYVYRTEGRTAKPDRLGTENHWNKARFRITRDQNDGGHRPPETYIIENCWYTT